MAKAVRLRQLGGMRSKAALSPFDTFDPASRAGTVGSMRTFDWSPDAAAQKLKAVIQSSMPDFSASMAAKRRK